jgi:biofilm PGA synthesis N-glycosyltransferase PgaC
LTVFEEALGYAPVYTLLVTFLACYPLWGCALTGFGAVASTVRRSPTRWYVPEPGGVEEARARFPVVSVVIPAHDEEAVVAGAIERALAIRWPEVDVIVVDDGSTDGTRDAARPYVADGRARLLVKPVNEGKSHAINDALGLCRSELVLVLDADGQADPAVFEHMVPRFVRAPAVAAVTGNPRVLNTRTLLARLQAVEFASTVGIQRRGTAIWGRLMTFSGLCTLLDRRAVVALGGFAPDMATEDIDMTWRLQLEGFEVVYEPRALFGMQAPETVHAWWRQRLRWVLGLAQVLRRHGRAVLRPGNWRMWPILAECVLSLLWAHLVIAFTILWTVAALLGEGPPEFASALALFTCIVLIAGVLQVLFGIWVDAGSDPGIKRQLPWAAWYPLAYWALSLLTVVRATIPGLVRRPSGVRTWNVPRARES